MAGVIVNELSASGRTVLNPGFGHGVNCGGLADL
jgi:hypothetical protein